MEEFQNKITIQYLTIRDSNLTPVVNVVKCWYIADIGYFLMKSAVVLW